MIDYTLRKQRRTKHLRLRVFGDGRVVVSAPTWLGTRVVERFVLSKMAWIEEKLSFLQRAPQRKSRAVQKKEFRESRDQALTLVRARIAELNTVYGFSFGRITIRNQRTRWGSCSSQKNLSFNYRLLFLPPKEQDYIIVHELCHLREMNHSPRFWTLVEKTVPEYRELRRMLRERAKILL